MKNSTRFLLFLTLFSGLVLSQPAHAKLAAVYDQAIITITQINQTGVVLAADGANYKIISTATLNKAKDFENLQSRALYVLMGEKREIIALKPITEPPFTLPSVTSPQKEPVTLK